MHSLGTHVVEVGELDLHGGGQQVRGGLDDHRHHLGVEQGCVAAEQTGLVSQMCVTMNQEHNKGKGAIWCLHSGVAAVPLEGHDRSQVSVEDDSSHKGVVSVWKQDIRLDSDSELLF